MPRILTGAGILVALLVPALTFAAADDVSLTTDVVLTVNGITLNVSGSNASIQSITVNDTNLSVTLLANSTFQVSAPGLQRLNSSTATGRSDYQCDGTQSLVAFAPTATETVTINPLSTLCSTSGASGGSTSSSNTTTSGSSGSSSGSSGTVSATPATPATPAIPTITPATPAVPATPTTPASGLTSEQATSILSLLASFGADSATIASVQAVLLGTGTGASVSSVGSFTRDLELGVTSSEVKALQEFLNSHGYAVAKTGAGSSGKETTKFGSATRTALIKYQKAKGITPAAGYFGKKTRAAVNAE